jgi:glycosyltransferase involved in cell wall biosynthesis
MLALMQARRFQSEVVCPPNGTLDVALRERGIKMYPLEFGKHAFARRPAWHFSLYRRLRRIQAESRADALVINLDGNTPLITLAAIRAGIPIVRFSRFEFKPPTRWIDKFCWLKAALVICPSEHVRQQVLQWAPPGFQTRVRRLYDPLVVCAVSDADTRNLRVELNLGSSNVLGFVGRLHRGKRLDTAIRAVAEIRKCVPGAHMLIAGSHDGSPVAVAYERELRGLAQELGVQEAIHFLGYRADVSAVMSACNVLLLPSESESFGMVLPEAWAMKVPTVASDVGGCREITLASGGGRLFPPGDSKALSRQVLELLSNPALVRHLGASGYAWARQCCAPEAYAGKVRDLIEGVRFLKT